MSIHRFSAGVLAAVLAASLSMGSWADDQAAFEQTMAAAREVRKRTTAVGSEM